MHIIVAPDSFKGTATADQAAAGIAAGIREALPDATVITLPMADGGEGTSKALATAATLAGADVAEVTLPTADAIGRLTEATYFFNATDKTAYIDVAAASGLPAVAGHEDPLHADTYGTGVLIADAEARGALNIVLGLGGSATVDGGTGILAALGAACHDARGYALPKGGAPLVQLASIDTAQLNIKAGALDYTLLADTRCNARDCAAMYAPQKGAKGQDVALLTGALLQLCEVLGLDPATESYGAAGGIPIALTWLSSTLWGNDDHLTITPGARFVADALGLSQRLEQADCIITGEGAFDDQSLTGKVVGTIADMAKESGTRLAIVAGRMDNDAPEGALSAQLSGEGELQQQLRDAGRSIAQQLTQ